MIKICDYGCGREAKNQFKNGKWCCSEFFSQCPEVIEKNRKGNLGKKRNIDRIKRYIQQYPGFDKVEEMRYNPDRPREKEIQVRCKYIHCENSKMNNGWFTPKQEQINERVRCYKSKKGRCFFFCTDTCHDLFFEKYFSKIINKKKGLMGSDNPMFGKAAPTRNTISKIKKKYPFFAQIEEMRYNPDKPGEKEMQVHCKNHLCPNSKEQGGWFTPTRNQFVDRMRCLEKDYGNGGCYFYCCEECKNECPLFGLRSDPLKLQDKPYTQEEYQTFRKQVLERDKRICQYCGEPATHVHHERPQKLEPFFALDPDYAWSCCEKCHYEKGHKDECSTGQIANTICL